MLVMIAGADYPQFSRNLDTETVPELGTLAEAVAANHTVHPGPAHPSRLILCEIPIGITPETERVEIQEIHSKSARIQLSNFRSDIE
ncbi:hypothetical protein [Nocardia alni]|uniref:hypothetical protein n=1 Tax=Nocardia alni TaxID=2815723 RepID=UPI001C21B947|nr:hypothetical protein [Nocardia alni]